MALITHSGEHSALARFRARDLHEVFSFLQTRCALDKQDAFLKRVSCSVEDR